MKTYLYGTCDMRSTRFVFLLSLSTFFPPAFSLASHLQCDVSAAHAVLMNAETGAILYEKNAHKATYPASTTKIATALYAMVASRSPLENMVTITHESVAAVTSSARRTSGKHPSHRLEFGGSHMNLKVGEVLPFKAILYGLLVCSSNDAANAIAEYVSGNIPLFMKELNGFLKHIGCKNTHFTNPHGLHDVLHQTSAYDLALMTRCALKFPLFNEIVKTKKVVRPKSNMQPESLLVQTNALLKPGKYFYPYATGVKTGYTAHAGSNLVAAAEKGGRRLIAVALNCSDSGQRYRSCISMFEAAFNEQKVERKLFDKQFDAFQKEVEGGNKTLHAQLVNDVVIEYYPSEEPSLQGSLHWWDLSLPISLGQRVGELNVIDQQGKVVRSEGIYATNCVEPTFSFQISSTAYQFLFWLQDHKKSLSVAIAALIIALAMLGKTGWRRLIFKP